MKELTSRWDYVALWCLPTPKKELELKGEQVEGKWKEDTPYQVKEGGVGRWANGERRDMNLTWIPPLLAGEWQVFNSPFWLRKSVIGHWPDQPGAFVICDGGGGSWANRAWLFSLENQWGKKTGWWPSISIVDAYLRTHLFLDWRLRFPSFLGITRRCMLLGRKAMINLDNVLKSRAITLPQRSI